LLSDKEVLKIFEYPKDRSEHWLIEEGSKNNNMKKFMVDLIKELKTLSKVKIIFGGYHLIDNSISTGMESFGRTSLVGFDINYINNQIDLNNSLYLCYIAVLIDINDNLIEDKALSDWNFEEKFVKRFIQSPIINAGAIQLSKVDTDVRFRTIKFLKSNEQYKKHGKSGQGDR
tara:strand:- start:97 stop:615 length:519 start_codon:yes stop_codon:yes gene_type:complete